MRKLAIRKSNYFHVTQGSRTASAKAFTVDARRRPLRGRRAEDTNKRGCGEK
jgi:hypothetical protein